MRILYYYPNYDTPMFQWQKKHIFDEMATHECFFDIISPFEFESIDEANEAIAKRIKTIDYSIFMSSYSIDYLYLDTLEKIKRQGVKTLCFCPDNLTVPFNQKNIARFYDLVWLTSKETEYLFRRWGAKTIFLPYAANPNLFKIKETRDDIERLAFIGTPHGSRVEQINMFLQHNIPMTLYSRKTDTSNIQFRATPREYLKSIYNYIKYPIGRKLLQGTIVDKLGRHAVNLTDPNLEMRKPVSLDELGEINSLYSLVLSFTEANSTGVLKKPVDIVNLRNFEIPMSGGIQFCRYTDEIASYFEPGKEIVLYTDRNDAIEKAKYYLSESKRDLRMNIRRAARARAEAEHTWYHRFKKIFKELNITELEDK